MQNKVPFWSVDQKHTIAETIEIYNSFIKNMLPLFTFCGNLITKRSLTSYKKIFFFLEEGTESAEGESILLVVYLEYFTDL